MDPSQTRYQNFLSTPSPNITKHTIDFAATDIPEYEGYYACILDNVLSPTECANLVRAAKAQTKDGEWQQATINAGFSGQQVDPETRLCGRIIWDNELLASRIWARCRDHIPELLLLRDKPGITGGGGHLMKEDWSYELQGLNPSMRFLRYFDGNYFRPHLDAPFHTQSGETSFLTLHLYLNEANEDSLLQGGATTFHAHDYSGRYMNVVPKTGRVLLFQQKGMLHSGADVTRGVKYTMRTDVLYKKRV
ncbi:MAG: hypothetical protein Q9219_007619 [cf. Caloplaca sp. 3 TL-2023]